MMEGKASRLFPCLLFSQSLRDGELDLFYGAGYRWSGNFIAFQEVVRVVDHFDNQRATWTRCNVLSIS